MPAEGTGDRTCLSAYSWLPSRRFGGLLCWTGTTQEPKQLRELEGVPDPKETRISVQAESGVMREEKRVRVGFRNSLQTSRCWTT